MGHQVEVIAGEPYPQLVSGVKLVKLPGLNLFAAKSHITALRPKHLLSWTDFFEWFSMLTGGFPEPYTFGRRLVRYFNSQPTNYDIIHDNQSLCYGIVQLQKMGYPIVTTIHHPITSDREIALQSADKWKIRLLIKRWYNFLRMQKKVAQQLEHLVTVSDTSRRDIAEAFAIAPEKIEKVYNGIDTEIFSPQKNANKKPLTIMTTASADAPLKGLGFLIKAISILKYEFPDIELLIVGKPSKDSDTEELINSLGLGKSVNFVSDIATDTLVDLYNQATVVVVPSIYEGFGFPAGEAMACGAPLISTNGGALPELVGDAGIIVDKGDAQAIADAARELLDDPNKRLELSKKGRKRIELLFNWQRTALDMTRIYESILNRSEKD